MVEMYTGGFMVERIKKIRHCSLRMMWKEFCSAVAPKIKDCAAIAKDIYVVCFWFFTAVYFLGAIILAFRSTPEIAQGWINFPGNMVVHLLRFLGANI
jgi:hypothetical protein